MSRAAQELGVTASAVSQQIGSLEVYLGTSLMVKSGRRVVLTEAGERYFEMIAENVDRISDATQNVRGTLSVKALSVRATPSLSTNGCSLAWAGSSMQTRISMCGSMRPMNPPIFPARASISKSVMARGTGPGFSSRVSWRSDSCRSAPRPLPGKHAGAPDLPGYRLIHSVKSQMQWGRWFTAAGVVPTLAPRAVRPQPYVDRRRRERDRDCARERSDDVARIGGRRSRISTPASSSGLSGHSVARLPARSLTAAPRPRLRRLDTRGARSLAGLAQRKAPAHCLVALTRSAENLDCAKRVAPPTVTGDGDGPHRSSLQAARKCRRRIITLRTPDSWEETE